MRVLVYVEGPSDKFALEALLEGLLHQKSLQGIGIEFFAASRGDRKTYLLTVIPQRAVNILLNNARTVVAVMPDLYPRNKGFPHETVQEMTDGIMAGFRRALQLKCVRPDTLWTKRFRVFCFKYDLESLLLAAEEALQRQLGARSFGMRWRKPVEEQDHDHPPKRVIEELFRLHGKRYIDTVHAPSILRAADRELVAARCPQCFAPFLKFLQDFPQEGLSLVE